jgi:hypothetical protein
MTSCSRATGADARGQVEDRRSQTPTHIAQHARLDGSSRHAAE